MSEEMLYDFSDHGGPVFTGPLAPFEARAYRLAFNLCFGALSDDVRRETQDELDGVLVHIAEMREKGEDRAVVTYPRGLTSPVIIDRTSQTAFEAATKEPVPFTSPELEDLARRIDTAKKRLAERNVYVMR